MIKIKDNKAIININPKLYPLSVIYSSAYVFLDKVYIMLDGDPKKEVIITITPKNNDKIEDIAGEFGNELINYAEYEFRSKETKEIRETLIKRALFTNDPKFYLENEVLKDEKKKE
jgi:His-Xaa-Ser system protein HxsD